MKSILTHWFMLIVAIFLLCACQGRNDDNVHYSPPSAPQNVKTSQAAQKIIVSWDSVSQATEYNIYWRTSGGVTRSNGTKITNVSSPFIHPHLITGNTYYYVVTAMNASGESSESVEVSMPINLVTFVTSTTGTGKLEAWSGATGTGVAAGDSICQARATAAGLSGTFKAWLSDSANDAYCHITGYSGKRADKCGLTSLPASAGPWVRMDGFPFAGSIDQIAGNTFDKIYTPVKFDESGNRIPEGSSFYFTATDWDGTAAMVGLNTTCNDWTSSTAGAVAVGEAYGTGSWTWRVSEDCSLSERLLCLQAGSGPALPSFTSAGKKIFVTSTGYNGNLGGIAGADAKCQSQATTAGLINPSHFKAWISDDAVSIISRITNTIGPWVRLDGVKVADSFSELTSGEIFTSIDITETGTYLNGPYAVWTGTKADGTNNSNTCNSWSDGTAASNGDYGVVSTADASWTDNWYFSCDSTIRLYCIED